MIRRIIYTICTVSVSLLLTACNSNESSENMPVLDESSPKTTEESNPVDNSQTKGSRDNTISCLVPKASGTNTLGTDTVTIDISNTSDGYICVKYTGDALRTRIMLTTPDDTAYTYDLTKDVLDTFPLTGGSGTYNVGIYELISGNDYSVLFCEDFSVDNIDEYSPYLYPNQYVNFNENSKAVELASELVSPANNDAEAISLVYNYVIGNITYDHEKAENVESTYVPDVDNILSSGKGICFDYASLMAAMLRSQGIPTRLEIGYAGDAYHAWISTYIKDVGWVNGMIKFDGINWELMDPTFAANMSEDSLKSFIGEGDNYVTKYMY
ncbi:MAG: transglutaminase domain-containing protein [Lachnospiraceae bacterium]|nr:transglutaminase domain-containing protein [Lachnospiraceae bacterium]